MAAYVRAYIHAWLHTCVHTHMQVNPADETDVHMRMVAYIFGVLDAIGIRHGAVHSEVYIYICICMHICAYACTYTYAPVCVCAYAPVCVCAYAPVCVCAYVLTGTRHVAVTLRGQYDASSSIHTYIRAYVHACMRACVHACMRAYIHTHAHLRTHTRRSSTMRAPPAPSLVAQCSLRPTAASTASKAHGSRSSTSALATRR